MFVQRIQQLILLQPSGLQVWDGTLTRPHQLLNADS